MLELYHSGLTTCSKQVRHCLREKGLAYKSRYVELWRYENLSPAYLKLNPNGVVPTLVHDGTPIINSFCINEYIEDAFPDPPLRPADLKERARMRYWAWTADEIHLQLARLTHARMLQASVNELSADDQKIMLEHTPVPDKRERWRVLTKGGYSAEQLDAALDNVIFIFGRMDDEIGATRSMACRRDLLARRHQHARDRPPHLRNLSGPARPLGVFASDGLVGPRHGAAGREVRLCQRTPTRCPSVRRRNRSPAFSNSRCDAGPVIPAEPPWRRVPESITTERGYGFRDRSLRSRPGMTTQIVSWLVAITGPL